MKYIIILLILVMIPISGAYNNSTVTRDGFNLYKYGNDINLSGRSIHNGNLVGNNFETCIYINTFSFWNGTTFGCDTAQTTDLSSVNASLNYLNNSKVNKSGDTMSGNLNMDTNNIFNVKELRNYSADNTNKTGLLFTTVFGTPSYNLIASSYNAPISPIEYVASITGYAGSYSNSISIFTQTKNYTSPQKYNYSLVNPNNNRISLLSADNLYSSELRIYKQNISLLVNNTGKYIYNATYFNLNGSNITNCGNCIFGESTNLSGVNASLDFLNNSKVDKSGDNMTGDLKINVTNHTERVSLMDGNDVFQLRDNGTIRSALYSNGIQEWKIRLSAVDTGYIIYSAPSNSVGILFRNASAGERTQMYLAPNTGLSLSSSKTSGINANNFTVFQTGNVGLSGAGKGIQLVSPDGLVTACVTLSNLGVLTTTAGACT